MIKNSLLSILILILSLFPRHGFTQNTNACPVIIPSIKFDYENPSLSRSKTFKQLSLMDKELLNEPHLNKDRNVVAGRYNPTTTAQVDASLNVIQTSTLTLGCFLNFELHVHMSSIIYLAAEIPKGGCMDQTVYQHEFHHHEIQIQEQNKAAQAFFILNPLPLIPFKASNPSHIKQLAEQYQNTYAQTLIDSFLNFVNPVQTEFDSPSEYARIENLCSGELQTIMARTR